MDDEETRLRKKEAKEAYAKELEAQIAHNKRRRERNRAEQEERDRTRQLLWVEVPRPQYWFPEGVSKCRTLRRYAWAATRSLLPVIEWAPKTRWSSFRADLVAGLTVGVMLIPQSMSYARIAGLDYKYGMYSG